MMGSPGSALASPNASTPARTPGRSALAQPLPEPPQLLQSPPPEYAFDDALFATLYPFKAAEDGFAFVPPKKTLFLRAVHPLVEADDGKAPLAAADVTAAQELMCAVLGVNFAEASSEAHVKGVGERSWAVRFSTLMLRRIVSTSKDNGGTFADYYYK